MMSINELLQRILCAFRGTESDQILLCFGKHEIKVDTCCKPRKVFLAVIEDECCSVPVCTGNITTLGSVILDDGFLLYVDVETSACVVQWVVEF